MTVKTKEYTNLFEIYHRNSLTHPQSTYIAHGTSNYTYTACNAVINKVAAYLQHKTQKDKPIVGLAFTDQFKFIISFWACAKLEADIVLFQKTSSSTEMVELETLNVDIDVMLSDDDFEATDDDKIDFKTSSKEIHFKRNTKNNTCSGCIYFFTSGTTGKSKFIQTTYYQVVQAINAIKEEKLMPYTENQSVLITAPLFHSYGLSSLIEYTSGNSKIMLPPTKKYVNPIQCLFNKKLSSEVTAIEGVPYFYQQMALFMKRIALPNLQHIGMGGNAVSEELIAKFHAVNDNLTFSIRYGITEIPSIVSINYFKYSAAQKFNELGKIPSIYTIAIEKDEEDATTGELSITHFFLPEVKKKIHTGDIFEQEANKFRFISRNSFIKYRGYKINPVEIETHLLRHKSIDDCRVVLINDILTAEVVTIDDDINLGTIKAYLKEKLRDYMSPDRVKVVDFIQRTKTGKIIRH